VDKFLLSCASLRACTLVAVSATRSQLLVTEKVGYGSIGTNIWSRLIT